MKTSRLWTLARPATSPRHAAPARGWRRNLRLVRQAIASHPKPNRIAPVEGYAEGLATFPNRCKAIAAPSSRTLAADHRDTRPTSANSPAAKANSPRFVTNVNAGKEISTGFHRNSIPIR